MHCKSNLVETEDKKKYMGKLLHANKDTMFKMFKVMIHQALVKNRAMNTIIHSYWGENTKLHMHAIKVHENST